MRGTGPPLDRCKAGRFISVMRRLQKSRFILYARTYESVPLMYLLSKRHSRVVKDKGISAEGN